MYTHLVGRLDLLSIHVYCAVHVSSLVVQTHYVDGRVVTNDFTGRWRHSPEDVDGFDVLGHVVVSGAEVGPVPLMSQYQRGMQYAPTYILFECEWNLFSFFEIFSRP